MAGIAFAPSVGQQVMLVATLRWRLFRNALRTLRGRLEAVAGGIILVFYGFFGLCSGAGVGIGTFFAVRNQKPEIITGLMWAVFLFWQFFSLFGTVSPVSARFDFAEFLRFPLRFSTFFLLSVAYGLCDPIAMITLFCLACMAVGISVANPGMLLWTASVLSVFAAVNVLFNRAILSWVERWMAQRRTREVLAMLFMLLMTCTQFIYPISMRWATRRWRVARGLQPLSYALPPGWGGRALAAAVAGNSLQAGSWLAVLTASGFILAWLLTIRLKRQYRGEDLGEARAATAVPRSRAGRGRWELGEFSGPVAAVFQKEILYLLRNWPMLLGLFSPLLILIYFGFSATGSARSGLFVRGPDLLFPLGAGFAALTLFAGAYNSLGFDGAGVQLYLVAPITFRDVLVGKNLAQAFTLLAEMSLVWVGVSILFGPPGGAVVGTTLAGLAFVALMTYTVGNPLSLCFPRRLQFGSMRAQQASGLAALASVGAQFLLVGIVATVYLLARHWGRLWLAAVLFLLLCVPATLAYLGTLNLSNRMAMSRRTVLTEELCH